MGQGNCKGKERTAESSMRSMLIEPRALEYVGDLKLNTKYIPLSRITVLLRNCMLRPLYPVLWPTYANRLTALCHRSTCRLFLDMSSSCLPVSCRFLPRFPQPHASTKIAAARIPFPHSHDLPFYTATTVQDIPSRQQS